VVCALAVVLTVALSLTGKPDSPPTSERAAPRQVLCHGAECTGEEPLASGCGDVEVEGAPKTLRTLRRSGVEVEIRYKPVCGAAWVRVTGQHVGDRFTISAPDVAAQHMVIADKYETGVYRSSPMVAVRAKDIRAVKACVELAGSSDLDCFQP
jgi:hypothetical protein